MVYKILEGAGSIGFNASTTEDRTNYFQPLLAESKLRPFGRVRVVTPDGKPAPT